MFQRIARRHADGSEEPVASEAAEAAPAAPAGEPAPELGDAPTERIEPVAPEQGVEQPTVLQPALSVPPPTRDLSAAAEPAAAPSPAPTPVAAELATRAGGEPTATQPEPRRPGFRARGRMRRRLRYLRKLREVQVRDLGGLVFDLRRFERKRDDLVARKLDQIRACDDELRALERALAERRDLRDVREPGIGGTCPRCFAVFGSADRFCANCGAALGGAVQGPAQVPLAPPAAAPPPAATPSPAPPATAPPGPSAAGPQQ